MAVAIAIAIVVAIVVVIVVVVIVIAELRTGDSAWSQSPWPYKWHS